MTVDLLIGIGLEEVASMRPRLIAVDDLEGSFTALAEAHALQ